MGWNLRYLNWDSHGAEREAQRALELDPDSADGWALLGLIRLSQTRADEAFDAGKRALERAFQEHAGFMVFLKIVAQFQGLQGDPRFERLVKRIGASN
jgi:hypothetical protein